MGVHTQLGQAVLSGNGHALRALLAQLHPDAQMGPDS